MLILSSSQKPIAYTVLLQILEFVYGVLPSVTVFPSLETVGLFNTRLKNEKPEKVSQISVHYMKNFLASIS